MTNRTNLATSYSSYEREPEKRKSNSFLDFFKGLFTIEPYENRDFVNTNHSNESVSLEDKKKLINDKGNLIKKNIEDVKYNELFNDAEYKLTNIKRDYELYKASNPGKKITLTNNGTSTGATVTAPAGVATAGVAAASGVATVSTGAAGATTGTTIAGEASANSPTMPPVSSSTISGVTLGENEYTIYDSYIDEDIIKMPAKSASEYLRNRNNVNSASGSQTVKKTDDDFINQIEGQLSIIKFFRDILYSVNKESFTFYKESFENHNLKDLKDNTTYTLQNKDKLVYNKGVLTKAMVDNTKYGDVLARVNTDIITINKQYDKFLNDNGSSSGSGTGSSGSLSGSSGSGSSGSGTTGSSSRGSNNEPQGVSTRNNSSNNGSNYDDSYDASCNTMNIKCVADFGTEIGDDLCCGQEGELESTKYVCPNTMPTCSNYKCGSNFGTCS
jgi:uncharacterized membrane protein YgcG